jgi:hypothetical protein
MNTRRLTLNLKMAADEIDLAMDAVTESREKDGDSSLMHEVMFRLEIAQNALTDCRGRLEGEQ